MYSEIFDLKSKLQFHGMSDEDRAEIWDDGLHFSIAGYGLMGELVTYRLVEILRQKGVSADSEGSPIDVLAVG